MQFFDLVATDNSSESLARRLGYKKMLVVGRDVEVVERLGQITSVKKIVRSDDFETLTKALKQNDVIGMMQKSASVNKKVFEVIKHNEKALFLPVSPITCADAGSRMQQLAKARSLVRNALMAKVPLVLVSLAEEKEGLMSSAQMIEIAGFLGIDHSRAKEALSRLGDIV